MVKRGGFFGDAGYQGIHKRDAVKDKAIDWHVAMRKGKRTYLEPHQPAYEIEAIKASMGAKVEPVFKVIKCQFGYRKVGYRGLAKNTERLYWLNGFTNLLRCRRWLAWGDCARKPRKCGESGKNPHTLGVLCLKWA